MPDTLALLTVDSVPDTSVPTRFETGGIFRPVKCFHWSGQRVAGRRSWVLVSAVPKLCFELARDVSRLVSVTPTRHETGDYYHLSRFVRFAQLGNFGHAWVLNEEGVVYRSTPS